MPTDTKPTTLEEAIDYARRLEDENAKLRAAPPAQRAITPTASQAIAAKLQGRLVPATVATSSTSKVDGPRVIVRLGKRDDELFVATVVDVDLDAGKATIELREARGEGRHRLEAWRETLPFERLLLWPEGWR